ncbi:MAG: hypothetical protein E7149_04835 [Rikenellaceae bacterium]|nr:hypothetical protein [Rikenellaceae bacterium]
MRKCLFTLLLLLCGVTTNAQIVEPEYVGQAYALLQSGDRVPLSVEVGYFETNSNGSVHSIFWGVGSSRTSYSGSSHASIKTSSVEYINVPGQHSLVQLRINEPFSVVLRLDRNDYLPEMQMKVVRFACDNGKRYAHGGSCVPFRAVKVGQSSYQITLDRPFYGEYGVAFKNDMNVLLTFSLGYTDADVREYVAPFLEPNSVAMIKNPLSVDVEILDREQNVYVDSAVFAQKYGIDFLRRITAEYKRMQKMMAKERKAQKKAQRKAAKQQKRK